MKKIGIKKEKEQIDDQSMTRTTELERIPDDNQNQEAA